MAETTIEWADYTFNPWIVCTKVSAGCANCYAEKQDNHRKWTPDGWGKGKPRKRTSETYWRQPLKWNREASGAERRPRVFCASLADVFDVEVPDEWRADLFALIMATPHLDWLLLTKRPENVEPCLSRIVNSYLNGPGVTLAFEWMHGLEPKNVWLGTSIENQQAADERIPHLLKVPATVHFLSCEPILGSIYFNFDTEVGILSWLKSYDFGSGPTNRVGWVIGGGESGPYARPMHPDWARSLRDQCQAAGVPFLFKQWGEWVSLSQSVICADKREMGINPGFHTFECASCSQQWKAGVKYLDKTHCTCISTYSFGKKLTGRLLDGRTWDEFPEVAP